MDKRKVTKNKGSKSKKKNDQAEVFVLPPNLLEQLGINLGNIETAPASTRERQDSDKDNNEINADQYNHIISNNTENDPDTNLEKESSMIQTANLMQESVFLSPSFISSNTGVIQGEFEVAANNCMDKTVLNIHDQNLGKSEVEEAFFVLPDTIMTNSDYPNSSSGHTSMFTHGAVNNCQTTDVHTVIHNNTKEFLYDEHADEAYSSDCSNSNIDKADDVNSSDLHPSSEIKQNNNKKINIISELIIDPSRFQKINNYSPTRNNLIPVAMNTVISSHHKNSMSYENNVNICPDLITDCPESNRLPSEMIDGTNTSFPTEMDRIFFYANENETILGEIETKESNNDLFNENIVISIQKQDELSHDNESLELCTPEMQQISENVLQTCDIDKVEQYKIDVLMKSFSESTPSKLVCEEEKVNDNLEKLSTVLSHEESINIKSSSTNKINKENDRISISTQCYIEEKPHTYGKDVKPVVEYIIKRDANDLCFNQNHNDTLNIDNTDLKNKNSRSGDIMCTESNINNITDTVDKCADTYDSQCCKKQHNDSKKDLKVTNNERSISISDIISTESITNNKTNTKINAQKCTRIDEKQCSKLQNKIDKQDLKLKNLISSSSNVASADIIRENINTKDQEEEKIDRRKRLCSKKRKDNDINDLKLKNNNSSSKDVAYTDIISENTSTKARKQTFVDKGKRQCSKKQKEINLKDLKLDNNNSSAKVQDQKIVHKGKKRCSKKQKDIDVKNTNQLENNNSSSSDAASTDNISINTSTAIQEEKIVDKGKRQSIKKLKDIDKTGQKLKSNNSSSNEVPSTDIVSENSSSKVHEKNFVDESKRQSSNIQEDIDLKDLKLENNNSTGRDAASPDNISINTSTAIQEVKFVDKRNSQFFKTPKDINKKDQKFTNNNSSGSHVVSIDINTSKKSRTKIQKEHFIDQSHIDEKDLKLNNINGSSSDVVLTDSSIISKNTRIKIQEGKTTDNSKRECSKKLKDFDKKDQKPKKNKISSDNIMSSDSVINTNTHTTINVEEKSTYESECQSSKKRRTGENNTSQMPRSESFACRNTENAANVEMEKVKEIAKYLSQYAEIQKRNICNDSNTTMTPSNKKQVAKSKLSIQGVEKPGGSLKKKFNERNKGLKTYARKNKRISTVKNTSATCKSFNISTQKIDLPAKNQYHTCNENDLCLCRDFGRLTYFDIQNVHDKICNLHNTNEICTPDIIFSMYNEDALGPRYNVVHINDYSVEHEYTCAINETMSCDDITPISVIKRNESILENLKPKLHETNNTDIGEKVSPQALKRKFSSTLHGSDEPPAKKHRDSDFPSKCSELTEKENSAKEENTVQVSQNASANKKTASVTTDVVPVTNEVITCGVCQESIRWGDWQSHIESQHHYLAWKSEEPALDVNNEEAVREHLYGLSKEFGGLKCAKCGIIRKYVKSYLTHIKDCDGLNESVNTSSFSTSSEIVSQVGSVGKAAFGNESFRTRNVKREMIECGVCLESMQSREWQSHIESQHEYLAWESGKPALDVDNEDAVREHLYGLLKEFGRLKCAKCGTSRKYVKCYLTHIQDCDGLDGLNESLDASALDTSSDVVSPPAEAATPNSSAENETVHVKSEIIKCGVCQESMPFKDWQSHIETQHYYMAWKSGEQALDVDDEEAVRVHLYDLTKEFGGLKCAKCGAIRKYVKSYLTHIQRCNGPSETQNDSVCNDTSAIVSENHSSRGDNTLVNDFDDNSQAGSDESETCGVCEESVKGTDWLHHIESRHDYLAWKHGGPILDVNNLEAIHDHLYDIAKSCGALKCSKCGLARKYVKSYLNHIEKCNGPNESRDGSELNASVGVFVESSNRDSDSTVVIVAPENDGLVKCGVCGESTQDKDWVFHIRTQHNYMAWKLGDEALDLEDKLAVRNHLYDIAKEHDGLECSKCGVKRRYVKSYLSHFNSCRESDIRNSDDTNSSTYDVLLDVESSQKKLVEDLVKCGTCGQYMVPDDWMEHATEKHNYIAWKVGDPSIDVNDKVEVRHHLQKIIEEIGHLTCSKCGLRRKYVKGYLKHIKTCHDSENSTSDSPSIVDMDSSEMAPDEVITPTSGPEQIKCGVCGEILQNSLWISHIAAHHKYMAWKEGETPLDVNDTDAVRRHLRSIIKQNGYLTCKPCDKKVKVAETYLKHRACVQQDVNVSVASVNSADCTEPCVDFESGGTCDVCQQPVPPGSWIQHTQRHHNYLAWRVGEKPWDLNDFTEINEHLYVISKRMDGLTCNKCGVTRKYVKAFLTHIKNCTGNDSNLEFFLPDEDKLSALGGLYQCAMCKEKIEPAQWKQHAMKEHYNITWIVGQPPIDLKNPYAVERYLKEYKNKHGLKCKCGATRVSCAGFYAHIITCGKSEEEIEIYKSICEICNNSYLCIYKSQHMAIHRVQEHNKELKLQSFEPKEDEVVQEIIPSGKRKAAQKARSVIENYTNNLDQHAFKCESCGFGTAFREELKSHKCELFNEADFSGEESSSAEEPSGDDSAESSIDSEASADAEEEEPLRKRHKPSASAPKVSRLPFQVTKRTAYLLQADEDFCSSHFTDEILFPVWHSCEHEMVSECDLARYFPPIEVSCKFKSDSSWITLKRFEAINDDGIRFFTGACIASISWIPLRVDEIRFSESENFLAVACHNDVDEPRYRGDETLAHENLIQIWEFNHLIQETLPKLVFGIAHDFGTVWSMEWCPSGARDALPEDPEDGEVYRLGLVAVACSNGSGYIFSVPYPSTVVKNDMFMYKLKPVAELRMSMSSNRKLYQATSITWSKEKGHKTVLVGYADGSTAYYDLSSDSPLLRTVEKGVDVFFPYHDERPHNSSITATDLYPSALCPGAALGVAAAATGSTLRAPAAAARARLPAAGRAAFAPLWPAALLAGDTAVLGAAVTEAEWGWSSRRLGGAGALAGCARCGAVAAAAPPALRLARAHPVYPDLDKKIFAMWELARLDNKKSKRKNDELAIQVEPATYADTIQKYGIDFRTIREATKELKRQCTVRPRGHCPERFPLAEIKSMAFCPSRQHHNRLAVAMHAGLVFLVRVS